MRVVGQLCSQKYKWFQFIIAPLVLYLPFPWEGPASTSLCQDLGIPSPHGIPVLVEGKRRSSFHLGTITSFSRKNPAHQAPAKVTGCQSLGCWQVSWLCWAPSNSHLLPGVPRVTGDTSWHSCLLLLEPGKMVCKDSAGGNSPQ